MKKTVFLLGLVMVFFACNSKTDSSKENENVNEELKVQTIDEVVANTERNVGNTIFVKGLVTHTCEHSGRRCFIENDDESLSLRIDAGGDIKSFSKELAGSIIAVKGTLEENRLTNEYIDEYEAKVKAKEKEEDIEEGGEHCSAEISNIIKMRKWMKDNNKDYYPVYYITGESYEVVE
ncbi:hypothetical protein C7377_0504 [Balneicella halophila]|uniref:Uncharacterized protein n=1 Tax=Balneicella halophila TaxID=1537566 RepID=A0A7L4UQZ4_BALHA|nr:hypothetical protein [Balneicella halophila]PVX52198.1 hypothetical protein C7377_0504 [Balneicella halophila]